MGSVVRNTEIAKELERFLDANEEDLSPNLYEALESLAADVDIMAEKLEDENEDLKSEIKELKERLRDTESERDELQNQLSEDE